jgi:PAS domain S-box-containing protein
MIDKKQITSENFLNLLMDASPNFITISDGEKIIIANQSMLNFFEVNSVEEFLEKHSCISELFIPYSQNALLHKIGQTSWIEYVLKNPNKKLAYILKDNKINIFKVFAAKISLENKTMYATVFNDITELEEQKERYTQAIEGSYLGLWDWNLVNNTLFISPYWKEMIGYKDDELESSFDSWIKNVHPNDLEKALADIETNNRGETSFYHNIHRLKHKDGHWVWIEDRGKTFFNEEGEPIRMVGTHIDISKQKENEEINIYYRKRADILLELPNLIEKTNEKEFMQSAQELAENLTQSNISFIHFINDDQNTIELGTWSNKTLNHYCKAVHDTHYPVNDAGIWADALREKKAFLYNHYESVPNKKGLPEGHAHLERFISLPVIENGKVTMLFGVGNKSSDYTKFDLESLQLLANETYTLIQRRRNLTKLKEQQEMLVIQSRYSAMGEMISIIAHQWRQPVSIIEMCANNIFLDIELDEFKLDELKKQLEEVTKQTQYLSHTIDDFRDFFKPHKVKSTLFIDVILQRALRLMEKSFETHAITINVNGKTTTPVKILGKELMQVFLNILNNAKDALLMNQIKKPSIDIELFENSKFAQVTIKDNAGGIKEDILVKIFEPYFTTKNQKDGTGLGLYISKIIVEKHLKGHISASNTQDGACFEISLPKS